MDISWEGQEKEAQRKADKHPANLSAMEWMFVSSQIHVALPNVTASRDRVFRR